MTHNRQIVQALYSLFGFEVEYLARETGFVQRDSPLTGRKFVLAWVLGFLERPCASLEYLAQVCADLGVEITRQALQQRLARGAAEFMQRMFERAYVHLQQQVPLPLALLQQFSLVQLLDSTNLALPDALADHWPGAGGDGPRAGLKLQVLWDFLRDTFKIDLTATRVPDQRYIQDRLKADSAWAPPESLFLADLGYFVLDAFAAIAVAGAYFLSRFEPGAGFYAPTTGKRIDLLAYLQALPPETAPAELWGDLGDRPRLPCRVMATRVSPEVVAHREQALREKARRRRQPPPSAERLAWLHWNVYVTNVPASRLSAAQAILLYHLRWQIEIVFPQMTKTHVLAAGAGGNNITDLDLFVGHHHAVN
jgi:hypothetical protein